MAAVSKWADVIMVLVPDTTAAKLYKDAIEPNLAPGKMLMFAHGFNIRFGTITVASRRRRHDGRAESRPATACASCTSKAPARRRSIAVHQDATGKAQGADAVVRQGHRRDPRRRHRDDVCRRDRNRSLRRAGGAVRRRQRAGQGRIRDAGRGRLPAGGRLLRVPARAEADRRSDLSGRPELHALLGQRHRRARRLHRRPAPRHGRDQGGNEEDARGDPQRPVREGLDRGERDRPPVVRGQRAARSGRIGSRRSAPSSAR